MTTRETVRIETPDGVTLDAAAQGARKGPAVLLLHGYSDSWRSYEPLLAVLPPALRAVAVSLRGHGDSDRPARGYGIRDLAGDLPAVLNHLDIDRAAVIGHSMGSMVAARLAFAHPERVSALVLIGALTTLQGNAAIDDDFCDDFCDAIAALADPVDAGFVPRIAVPTLLLWGDRDGLCDRASQTRMARALATAEFSVLPGAGHAPHWEDPRGVAAAVTRFLEAARAA